MLCCHVLNMHALSVIRKSNMFPFVWISEHWMWQTNQLQKGRLECCAESRIPCKSIYLVWQTLRQCINVFHASCLVKFIQYNFYFFVDVRASNWIFKSCLPRGNNDGAVSFILISFFSTEYFILFFIICIHSFTVPVLFASSSSCLLVIACVYFVMCCLYHVWNEI